MKYPQILRNLSEQLRVKKKHLIVSIESKGSRAEAKLLRQPITAEILKVLSHHIALHGLPNRFTRDSESPFRWEGLRQFSRGSIIEYFECPIGDRRWNGKIERCIRTKTERLRANKKIVLETVNPGLSDISFLYARKKGQCQETG